jgi:hypothetical protein
MTNVKTPPPNGGGAHGREDRDQFTDDYILKVGHAMVDFGWAIFPLQGRGGDMKAPATAHGFYDATKDHAQVDLWWGPEGRYRGQGIGIATGAISNLCVIDVDDKPHANPPKHGLDTFGELVAELGLPDTPMVDTPGGNGFHLYFPRPEGGLPSRNDAFGEGSHIDVKCDGGYVVGVSSEHPNGGRYCWGLDEHGEEMRPSRVPLAALPEAWLARLRSSTGWTADHDSDLSEDDYEPLLSMFRAAKGFTVPRHPARSEWKEWRVTRPGKGRGCSVVIYPHPGHHVFVWTSSIEGLKERDLFWADRSEDVRRLAAILEVPVPESDEASTGESASAAAPNTDVPSWPELEDAALYGVAGEVVEALLPETEADPAGLLFSLFVGVGVAMGRNSYVRVGATAHAPLLNVVLAGNTSGGRKGTAWSEVRQTLGLASCVKSGIASGEVLIDLVAAQDDRRLLIVEAEFVRVLAMCKRDGSTLSPVLRQAYDGERLETHSRTKGSVEADGAHVGVLGQTTIEELRAKLDETEQANGFANRYLFVLVQRSKLLPSGGKLDEAIPKRLGEKLTPAIAAARRGRVVRRSSAAEEVWADLYNRLVKEEAGGLCGAVMSRAIPHCLRLSLMHALLDQSEHIEPRHIEAAAAAWRYSAASARYIFGSAIGDPVADRLLAEIIARGAAGLDLTERARLFGNNVKVGKLDSATDHLVRLGRIVKRTVPAEGAGRPRTVLIAREFLS